MKKLFIFFGIFFLVSSNKVFASSVAMNEDKVFSPKKNEVLINKIENSVSEFVYFDEKFYGDFFVFTTYKSEFSTTETNLFSKFESKIQEKENFNINKIIKSFPTGFSVSKKENSKISMRTNQFVLSTNEEVEKFFEDKKIENENFSSVLKMKIQDGEKIFVGEYSNNGENDGLIKIELPKVLSQEYVNFGIERFSDNSNDYINSVIISVSDNFLDAQDKNFINTFSDLFNSSEFSNTSKKISTSEVWVQKFEGKFYADESENIFFKSSKSDFIGTEKITIKEILKFPKTLFYYGFIKNFYGQMIVFFLMIFWQTKVKRGFLKLIGWVFQSPFIFFTFSISTPKVVEVLKNYNSEDFASKIFSITPYTFLVSVVILVIWFQLIVQKNNFIQKKKKTKDDSSSIVFMDDVLEEDKEIKNFHNDNTLEKESSERGKEEEVFEKKQEDKKIKISSKKEIVKKEEKDKKIDKSEKVSNKNKEKKDIIEKNVKKSKVIKKDKLDKK